MSSGGNVTRRCERLRALCHVFGAIGAMFFGLQLLASAAVMLLVELARTMLSGLHGGSGEVSRPWVAGFGGVVAWVVLKFVLAVRLWAIGTMLARGDPAARGRLRTYAIADIAANLSFALVGVVGLSALALRGDLEAPGVSLVSLLMLITLLSLIFPVRVLQVLRDPEVTEELARRTRAHEEWSGIPPVQRR